jgi:hypothetical protein
MIKVIVAGGRDFNDYAFLERTLTWLLSNLGGATYLACTDKVTSTFFGETYLKSTAT